MIKGRKLLWALSSMMLLSACTPTEAEEIRTSSSIEFSVVGTSVATDTKESKENEEFYSESAVSSVYSESVETPSSVSHDGYTLIEVYGGDLSGYRAANVVVDIGFGDREYWAYTNEYGQLVRVVAAEIILQDDATEPVNSNGRYYDDEANVPGTENSNLDQGHVIADSLGGVANAYNITPQDSVLNRHGDQAYMERNIVKQAVPLILRRSLPTQIQLHKFQVLINTHIRSMAIK